MWVAWFIICIIFNLGKNEKFCSMSNEKGSEDHRSTSKSTNHLTIS